RGEIEPAAARRGGGGRRGAIPGEDRVVDGLPESGSRVGSVDLASSSPGVTRFIDQGAVAAAGVGVGMALVTAVSFLLVIPIEPIYWVIAPMAGILIGYYANQRSGRGRGSWRRVVANAVYAGLAAGLRMGILLCSGR